MAKKFSDNGRALLVSSINASATSLTVESSKADRFPIANTTNWLTPADWFRVVLINSAGDREVIRVGTRTLGSGVFGNILRAQEGTTALSFTAGSAVILSLLASDIEQALSGNFGALASTSTLDVAGKMRQGGVEFRGTPVGGIIMWSGSIASIPTGWALCDGQSGRPDLRDRFVVGAGGSWNPAATGGQRNSTLPAHSHNFSTTTNTGTESTFHTHGVVDAGHVHSLAQGNSVRHLLVNIPGGGNYAASPGASTGDATTTDLAGTGISVGNQQQLHVHTFTVNGPTTSAGDSPVDTNLPPYFSLAYIICLAA